MPCRERMARLPVDEELAIYAMKEVLGVGRARKRTRGEQKAKVALVGERHGHSYIERGTSWLTLYPFTYLYMSSTEGKVCQSPGCGKPAKLQCPTCLKLKIEGSFFCSQECFKSNWVRGICNNVLMHRFSVTNIGRSAL